MKYLFSLSIASLALLSAGCNSQPHAETSTPQSPETQSVEDKSSGQPTYRIVAEEDATFTMMGTNGSVEGFDIELMNEIAKKQGFTVSYTLKPYALMFEEIAKGNADIAVSGIYITDERLKRFDFSEPYMETGTAAISKQDAPVKQFTDLLGKKVSVKAGTVAEKSCHAQLGDKSQIQASPTHFLALKDVALAKTDAMVGDEATLRFFAAQHKDQNLVVTTVANTPREHYAFLVGKGNNKLQTLLNEGLKAVKADGTYDRLYKKWFEEQMFKK